MRVYQACKLSTIHKPLMGNCQQICILSEHRSAKVKGALEQFVIGELV